MEERAAGSVEMSSGERRQESCCFRGEQRLQGLLRPAEWCLGFRAGRRQKVQWTFKNVTHEDLCNALDSILANLTDKDLKRLSARPVDTHKMTSGRKICNGKAGTECYFTIDLITAVGWLDTLDVLIIEGLSSDDTKMCTMSLTLAATGFLPLTVPGASICNIFCCWVPFLSVEQNQRLRFFKDKMSVIHPIDSEADLCNL